RPDKDEEIMIKPSARAVRDAKRLGQQSLCGWLLGSWIRIVLVLAALAIWSLPHNVVGQDEMEDEDDVEETTPRRSSAADVDDDDETPRRNQRSRRARSSGARES